MKIRLDDSLLALPVDVVTQTIGILAKRRAGKSYLARRLSEQLYRADQQIVLVDPKGDWWGIRSSRDGKGPGLPIIIVGGERGDVPLEVNGGELVAKLVVEERVSVLLDLSLLRKHEVATFMADFLETLYRMKAREQYRTPMMLLIDEADAIAPQTKGQGGVKGGNVERMLGAAEDIVRRGGQRGIGCTLITQRSAVLNKNVLTQVQILIALRTIAPQDLKAMNAWVDVHGNEEERKTLMESLPALPVGDAWVWSPGWPTTDGIFKRIHTAQIETFDSGSTPAAGEKRREPKKVAEVDLDALRRQMAATMERAKATDPKELQREIASLKKQLAAKSVMVSPAKVIERSVLTEAHVNRVAKIAESLREALGKIADIVQRNHSCAETVRKTGGANAGQHGLSALGTGVASPEATPAFVPKRFEAASGNHGGSVGKGEIAVLTAIAQHASGLSREAITIITGYKRSTRDAYLQRLMNKGLVLLNRGGFDVTPDGVKLLGSNFQRLPTGDQLYQHWLSNLPMGEAQILSCLRNSHPDTVSREAIGERTAFKRSTRDAYIQRLNTRKLIVIQGVDIGIASELVG